MCAVMKILSITLAACEIFSLANFLPYFKLTSRNTHIKQHNIYMQMNQDIDMSRTLLVKKKWEGGGGDSLMV